MKTGSLGADWEVTVKVIPLKGTKPPVKPNPKPELKKPKPEPEKPVTMYFKDVPKGHRAYEDIQKLYRAGIIDGKNN